MRSCHGGSDTEARRRVAGGEGCTLHSGQMIATVMRDCFMILSTCKRLIKRKGMYSTWSRPNSQPRYRPWIKRYSKKRVSRQLIGD